jgi:hypothetical protein
MLIVASRQCGKTQAAAVRALWTALYRPNSTVLLLAPVQRQSQELFLRALDAYRRLNRPVPAVREMRTALELVNGSRLVCLPGEPAYIRGFAAVTLVVIDEAAQIADDSLFAAVLPMLVTSNGACWCISTPFGRRGWFWEQYASDDPTWMRVTAPARLCPRIAPSFIEEQKRLLGPRWAQQEFDCAFLDSVGQVFSTDSVLRSFDPRVLPLEI